MEANLDDKYYQKYMQYKHKYLMLKQLNNNYNDLDGGNNYNYNYNNNLEGGNNYNDLEGGWGLFNWFSGKNNEEVPAAPAPDALVPAPAPAVLNENTDGTYLVFYIDDAKFNYHEMVKVFIQEYHNQIPVKDGHNFYKKTDFNNEYNENAYIVTKQGNTYTYKIITNILNGSDFDLEYKQIWDLQEPLDSNKKNCECNIAGVNLLENAKFDINLLKNKYDEINKLFKICTEDYNNAIGLLNTSFSSNIDLVKQKIIEIEKDKEIKKYKTNTLTTFSSDVFNVDSIPLFLENFEKETEKKMNMIIKIKDDSDPDYKFDGTVIDKSVSNTNMYSNIAAAIARKRAELNSMHTKNQNITMLPQPNLYQNGPGMPLGQNSNMWNGSGMPQSPYMGMPPGPQMGMPPGPQMGMSPGPQMGMSPNYPASGYYGNSYNYQPPGQNPNMGMPPNFPASGYYGNPGINSQYRH
jgi:hypothetical protein